MAILLRKRDYVEGKPLCVETEWWRIPYLDTPDCLLDRKYMLELNDHDPLSQKIITIIKAQLGRDEIVKNRYGVPIYLAAFRYKHSTGKAKLEEVHNRLVQDLKDGTFVLGEAWPDGDLRKYIGKVLNG